MIMNLQPPTPPPPPLAKTRHSAMVSPGTIALAMDAFIIKGGINVQLMVTCMRTSIQPTKHAVLAVEETGAKELRSILKQRGAISFVVVL